MMYEKLQSLRRELHQNPEVSGDEEKTAKRITAYLSALKPDDLITDLGGHGVLATFDSGESGPSILFRAELDALPIHESNTFEYVSSIEGVSHKCGHDGHTTILCGLAERLVRKNLKRGKVHLLFQPAEETGEGAKAVLSDAKFKTIKPDFGVALHNFPGVKKHSIIVKEGIFTIAVSSHIFYLKGYTSHASEPEKGRNPSLAVAKLLSQSDLLNKPDVNQDDFRLITPIHTRVGSAAYGVAAGDAEVHFTLRAINDAKLEQLRSELIELAETLSERYGLTLSQASLQNFHASFNDKSIVDKVRQSALSQGYSLIEQASFFRGGEDFGLFTTQFPCCMFGLGAGEQTSALHSEDYDFPDELIKTGIDVFDGIVDSALR